MKSCPTCNRTFEDTFTFCLVDGSILSAPFDPRATLIIPEPGQTELPPTEVFPLEEVKEEIPPTVVSISSASQPKSENNLTETQRLQLEYWTVFRDLLLQSNSFLKPPKPQPQNWFSISIGSSNFGLVATMHRKGRRICAYFVFYGTDAKPHFYLLQRHKEAIADEVGEPLEWRELPKGKESQIRLCEHKTDLEDRQDWKAQHEWLKEKLELFHKVFAPRIKNLNASEYVSETIEETKPELLPTIASPQPEQKPEESVSTIVFPAAEVELPRPSPSTVLKAPEQSVKQFKRTKVLIGIGVATVFLFVGTYSLLKNRNQSGAESANTNTAITSTTNTTNAESELSTNNSSRSSLPNTTKVDSTRIFLPEEVVQKARILSKPEATYTEEASENKITGTVVLRAVLSANGQVTEIRSIKGLPYGLTEKAIAAARQIKFTPAVKDGQLVSQYMRIEYNFNLY